MNLSKRSRLSLALLFLLLLAAAIILWLFWPKPAQLPEPGSPLYEQYQRAFQIGVAALDAGREDLAQTKLEQAVQIISAEPAGWANLGLLSLRKNDLVRAASELKQAHDLAPESGEIEALLGLLAEKQGRFPDAAVHLHKAVLKQPHDLALVFSLAQIVSKEGGDGEAAEYQRLMEQILKDQPNNLPVLIQRAETAFRRQDQTAFTDTLGQLGRLAQSQPGWKDLSRESLQAVRKAAVNDKGEVVPSLHTLDNVLKAERGYQRDSQAIRPQPGVPGTPIQHFLRLKPVRPTPAPPDRDLSWRQEPLPLVDAVVRHWDVAMPVWLTNKEQHAELMRGAAGGFEVRPAELLQPAIFLADGRQVRAGGAGMWEFPGGARSIRPSRAGLLAVDWNNDYRTDVLLAGAGGLRFHQQREDGSFADVTQSTGLTKEVLEDDYYGAWAADVEMDGDLDIVVARRTGPPLLLRNNGDGTFRALEVFGGVSDVRAFVWADLDNDGAPDAAFLDSAGGLHVFANERSGQFSAWPQPNPNNRERLLALTAADVNGDGILDLIALRSDGLLMRISDADHRQSWQLAMLAHGIDTGDFDFAVGAANIFAEDLDNNGAVDLILAGPRSTLIFLADEFSDFVPMASIASETFAVLDLDRDGRLDLLGLSTDGHQPLRQINQGKKSYRWQTLWPLANPAAGDNRINSFAVGGEIEVRSGPLVQKQPIRGPAVHFGLGEQPGADVTRIVWPNGVPQWEFETPTDHLFTAVQRLTGSCPFLFTHDGSSLRFAGDFMWGTPLGMFVNGQNVGDFPQTAEWLKIPGSHLKPKHGHYDVRVQANLWEADYFDQLALLVVDHPPGTEIHVDERFFLTPTAPHFHVTTPVKPVARAWDHRGEDVTELVAAVDGRYVDRCGRGRFQGVTQDHWVEIDLGDDAPREGPLVLIARGWLHPTNSSINVALAQGKHPMPMPLVLEVPDGKGGWKVGRDMLGFPAGKDKTMVLRLDGLDGTGVSCRFRLRTNMEIYWDFLGHARELETALAKIERPKMLAAELRYRGFLAMTRKDASSPELPHYDKVTQGRQPWRDLIGYYTRFGDVRELLEKVDDRYVIVNAGDEIALRFAVPAESAGGVRDFIWESDGWTRDGDLNTRFGDTVLPLPAHGKHVERRPGRLEDDPVYLRFPADWRTYHTRYVSADEFGRGLGTARHKRGS